MGSNLYSQGIIIFQVLGMGEKWTGGDMDHPGGAAKINMIKKEIFKYREDANQIIMFTDRYVNCQAGKK